MQSYDSEEELISRLSLYLVPGMGSQSFRRLIQEFSSPMEVFAADEGQLRDRVPDLSEGLYRSLAKGPCVEAAERQLEACYRNGVRIIHESLDEFPSALRTLEGPPPFLFVKGNLEAMDDRAAAVVGTRNPSGPGGKAAWDMAGELAKMGFTIVSGMALGIDTLAHKAALDKEGRTLAVTGVGFEKIYPRENKDLFHRIAERGAVLSEYPFGSVVLRSNFPRRNRIISGLSRAVLVVEAGADSGALITADYARKQVRPVFALPGAFHDKETQGTNELVRRGAGVICGLEDLRAYFHKLREAPAPVDPEERMELFPVRGFLHSAPRRRKAQGGISGEKASQSVSPSSGMGRRNAVYPNPELSPTEKAVATLLEQGPLSFDNLLEGARRLPDFPVATALASFPTLLLRLEIKRVIKKEPGARFSLV